MAKLRAAGAFPALVAAGAVLVLLRLVITDRGPSLVLYLIVVTLGAAAAWVGVWSRRPADPRPWRWLAAGVSSIAAADHVYIAYEWLLDSPDPVVSFADPLYLLGYGCIATGILGFGRAHSRERAVDGIIDAVQITVVALLLTWELSLRPVLAEGGIGLLEQLVTSSYPLIDVALIGLLVRFLLAGRVRSTSGVFLAIGLGAWMGADTLYMPIVLSDRYEGPIVAWFDILWMAGPLVMGLAALHPRMAEISRRRVDPVEAGPGPHRLMLSVVLLLVPGLVMSVSHSMDRDPSAWALVATTLVLGGLLMLRSVRLLRAHDRARAELHRRERYFEALAANASDAMLVLDRHGIVTNDSAALAQVLGLDGGTAGLRAMDLIDTRDAERAALTFQQVVADPGRLAGFEMRMRHADGDNRWLSARVVNLLDDPAVGGIVVNVHDVTASKRAELELAHQAFHDPLTGLANRTLFRNRVEEALRDEVGLRPRLAVVYLDLDGFKTVNDGLGHDRGDDLLRLVAARLGHAVGGRYVLARLGGDEFAVLVEDEQSAIDLATGLAEEIQRVFEDPFTLGGALVAVGASIGVAEGGPGTSADDLLRNADVAMYQAKALGKGCTVLFDAEMRVAAEDRLRLETDLVGALTRDEITLLYQPVIDLATGDLTGFEALARWKHPQLGLLTPDRFIGIAEETGLIVPIGAWVLEEACRAATEWQARFPHEPAITMAVNLSGRQLASPHLMQHVTGALERSGLEPHRLVLEVTESVLVVDPGTAAVVLTELRELGLRLAIDDFGTGYSSLSYLRQFPIDVLKIDKSFIATMTAESDAPAIVRALIELGHTLGMEIVAEGIELESQLAQLRTLRCERGQGYLFAKPLVPRLAADLVRSHADRRALDLGRVTR